MQEARRLRVWKHREQPHPPGSVERQHGATCRGRRLELFPGSNFRGGTPLNVFVNAPSPALLISYLPARLDNDWAISRVRGFPLYLL
jgi:hypothetical protein